MHRHADVTADCQRLRELGGPTFVLPTMLAASRLSRSIATDAAMADVYGLTEAMVGTLARIKKVGTISKADATKTAIVTQIVIRTGKRSQFRCQKPRVQVSTFLPIFSIPSWFNAT